MFKNYVATPLRLYIYMGDNNSSVSDSNSILPNGRRDILEVAKLQVSRGKLLKAVLIFLWLFMPLNVTRRHIASLNKKGGK